MPRRSSGLALDAATRRTPTQVAPVGDDRVDRAAPLGREPGEEVVDDQRRRVGRRVSRARAGEGEPDDGLGIGDLSPGDHVGGVVRASTCSTVMCCSSTPCRSLATSVEAGGEEHEHLLVASSRASCGTGTAARAGGGVQADLLGQLTSRRDLGRLAGARRGAGRDLEHVGVERRRGTGAPARPGRRRATAPPPPRRDGARCRVRRSSRRVPGRCRPRARRPDPSWMERSDSSEKPAAGVTPPVKTPARPGSGAGCDPRPG